MHDLVGAAGGRVGYCLRIPAASGIYIGIVETTGEYLDQHLISVGLRHWPIIVPDQLVHVPMAGQYESFHCGIVGHLDVLQWCRVGA